MPKNTRRYGHQPIGILLFLLLPGGGAHSLAALMSSLYLSGGQRRGRRCPFREWDASLLRPLAQTSLNSRTRRGATRRHTPPKRGRGSQSARRLSSALIVAIPIIAKMQWRKERLDVGERASVKRSYNGIAVSQASASAIAILHTPSTHRRSRPARPSVALVAGVDAHARGGPKDALARWHGAHHHLLPQVRARVRPVQHPRAALAPGREFAARGIFVGSLMEVPPWNRAFCNLPLQDLSNHLTHWNIDLVQPTGGNPLPKTRGGTME